MMIIMVTLSGLPLYSQLIYWNTVLKLNNVTPTYPTNLPSILCLHVNMLLFTFKEGEKKENKVIAQQQNLTTSSFCFISFLLILISLCMFYIHHIYYSFSSFFYMLNFFLIIFTINTPFVYLFLQSLLISAYEKGCFRLQIQISIQSKNKDQTSIQVSQISFLGLSPSKANP